MSEFTCEDCGGPMSDGGPCGWYCEAGLACPGHKRIALEAQAAVRAQHPTKADYDALAAKYEHALATERGKLEAADAENDRLAARVAHIKAAILEADEIVGDLEGVSISYYLRKAGRTDLLDTLGFTAADQDKQA